MPGALPNSLHRLAVAFLVAASFEWLAGDAHAAATVSNVRAAQRAGTKLVDIDYDLTGTAGWASVSVQVSADGGASYAVPAAAFTGDFGSVPAGRGRRVTWNAGADFNGTYSPAMRFKVTATDAPAGMVLIPAGSFQMGNSTNASDGDSDELPPHTVYVSAFYMDRYEVTKALWDQVRAWGLTNEYTDLPQGSYAGSTNRSKGSTHPVHYVNWYDMLKWSNARSDREGLTPVYYTDNAQTVVYKTGSVEVTNAQVKWNGNGYRLPTDAEWEKAARGGLSEQRFPWGASIAHSQANYTSSTSYTYDVSPTHGSHPLYGVNGIPYTSPVGVFAANSYGLFDMAGNVWEWCWDWYATDWYSQSGALGNDPQGPPSGSSRVLRGGGWNSAAVNPRVAQRFGSYTTGGSNSNVGFRCVRR